MLQRIFCIVLCALAALLLCGCDQTDTISAAVPVVSEMVTAVETQDLKADCLFRVQEFLNQEDFDSACYVLEQMRGIAEETWIEEMLTQIDDMRPIPLDMVVTEVSSDLKNGDVQIHSVNAAQHHNGYVRYIIDYTASEGMFLRLEGEGLAYTSPFFTTGKQDSFVFEIPASELRIIGKEFRVYFGFSSTEQFCLNLMTNWPGETLAEAIPVTLQQGDLEPFSGCKIHSIRVQAVDEKWLYYSVDYTASQPGMPISVQLDDQDASVLSYTDTGRRSFAFLLDRRSVQDSKRILLRIRKNQGSGIGASADLAGHPLPEKEDSNPVKEVQDLAYMLDNRLLDGKSYQIHNASAELLASGFVRYRLGYTAEEGSGYGAHGFVNGSVKSYAVMGDTDISGTVEIYLTVDDLQNSAETICKFTGIHPKEVFTVRLFHDWFNAKTDGEPVGSSVSLAAKVESMPKSESYGFESCTAQTLNNGYIRFAFSFTAPEQRMCDILDLPANFRISCGTSKRSGAQVITLDIPANTSLYKNILCFNVNMSGNQKDGMMMVSIDVSEVLGQKTMVRDIPVNVMQPQIE